MARTLLMILGLNLACYEESPSLERQEIVDLYDLSCIEMPPECEPDGMFSTCAEFDSTTDPCGWKECVVRTGQLSEWYERRACMKDRCGIPFNEKCFRQIQVFQMECFENDCHDEISAQRCALFTRDIEIICD